MAQSEGTLQLSLTPITNFDPETRQVLDAAQVTVRRFPVYERVAVIDLLADGNLDVHRLVIAAVNCFDHLLLLDGIQHRILNGFDS
jgi:hypothetical protein